MKVFLVKILIALAHWTFRLCLLALSLGFLAFSIKSMLFLNQKKHLIKALVRVPASQQYFQVTVMRVKNPTKLYYPDGSFLSEGTRGVSLGVKTEVITFNKGLIKLASPSRATLSMGANSRLTIGEPEVLNEKMAYEQYRLDHGTLRVVAPSQNKLKIIGPNLVVTNLGSSDFLVTHNLANNRYYLAVLNGRIEYRFKSEPQQVLESGKKISFASGQDFAGLLAYQEEVLDLGGPNLVEVVTKQDLLIWLNQLLPAENSVKEQNYLNTLLAHINFNQKKYEESEALAGKERVRLDKGLHPKNPQSQSFQISSELLKNDDLNKKWSDKTEIKLK